MDRSEFIKSCGLVCLGSLAMTTLLQSCGSHLIKGTIVNEDMVIPLTDFEIKKGVQTGFKKFLVVTHDILQYPICIYRIKDQDYSALWLRCTHQGTELQVFGDKLQCPAHGSEFDVHGGVQNGPADKKLRTFPVRIENDQLKISLKAAG